MSCNNGKDHRYIVGYQVDEGLIPLFMKKLKIHLVMVCHNTTKTLPTQYHLMFLKQRSECLIIKRFGMRLNPSYLKNWPQKW